MKDSVKDFLIKDSMTVREAMRQMGKVGEKILVVVDDRNRLLGTLTDGDIRRWVLADGGLTVSIEAVYNRGPLYVEDDYEIEKAKRLMLAHKIEWIPVINEERAVCEVLLWKNLFGKEVKIPGRKLDLPVVIMAGGRGTRLDPFTRILPKPLIPIGEKAVIEVIMDKFGLYGVNEFYISVNHKSAMIKAYFEEMNTGRTIHFMEEKKPLGTAGGLRFLCGRVRGSVLVSNCDILIECDYSEIVSFHESKGYDITIVGSFRHLTIPYGVCLIEDGGQLVNIDEKPEYDFLVNTGMYLLKTQALSLIPKNRFFNLTDLVQEVKAHRGKVGVFPVDEKSWIDLGQWEEYRKSVRELTLD